MSILSIRALDSLHSGQQSEAVQNRHAVRLQSQGGANLRGRSARSTSVTRLATWLSTKLAASPPIPAPTTTAWSTDHTVDAVDDRKAVLDHLTKNDLKRGLATAMGSRTWLHRYTCLRIVVGNY